MLTNTEKIVFIDGNGLSVLLVVLGIVAVVVLLYCFVINMTIIRKKYASAKDNVHFEFYQLLSTLMCLILGISFAVQLICFINTSLFLLNERIPSEQFQGFFKATIFYIFINLILLVLGLVAHNVTVFIQIIFKLKKASENSGVPTPK